MLYPQNVDHKKPMRAVLTFGRFHLYELEYTLAAVERSFGFTLNEVTCLRQVRAVRKDSLYAKVPCRLMAARVAVCRGMNEPNSFFFFLTGGFPRLSSMSARRASPADRSITTT